MVIRSVGRVVVKLLTLGGGFAEALALEREPVGVVHQAIEDGVGDGGIADDLVPVFDRQLAGHDGGAAAVPVFHDLQEVAALLGDPADYAINTPVPNAVFEGPISRELKAQFVVLDRPAISVCPVSS